MNEILKAKRIERDTELQKQAFELLQGLIKQPATGLVIGYLGLKGAQRLGLLSELEMNILAGLIASGAMLDSFKGFLLPKS